MHSDRVIWCVVLYASCIPWAVQLKIGIKYHSLSLVAQKLYYNRLEKNSKRAGQVSWAIMHWG